MTSADVRSASPSPSASTGTASPRGAWHALRPAPVHKPVHTAIARTLFHRVVPSLDLRVALPDGRIIGGGDSDAPLMRVRRDDFFRRLGADGLIGFGEAFMAGDWDADDPAAVLTPFAARMDRLVPAWMQRLRHYYVRHQPSSERNTKTGARANIQRHYDLSNELFERFLDDTMTYSCARFAPDATDESLADAQRRKVDTLLDATGVGLGSSVLEIGTGWGTLAVRAALRGATVTTLTLSEEQAVVARERARRAGVGNRVDVQLRDYRDVEGKYDAIVSVEMIEAVGHDYWPTYFTTLERALAPGGRIAVQAILLAHDRMLATLDQYTWISKYIFPGGALPSLRAIEEIVRDRTALSVETVDAFGADYARTLRAWRERFDAHAREVDALGFDATFRRMWDFYLAYCEAGFATGYLDVVQIVLASPRMNPVAPLLAATVRRLVGDDLPVGLRAWDGSQVGPTQGPVVVLRNRRALRRLLWRPDELGLARAYVTGDLDVDGDLADGLRRVWSFARARGRHDRAGVHVGVRDRFEAIGTAARLGVLGPPPKPPASEARIHGRLHSRARHRAVIAHHYDLSNEFYALLLDESMSYSCAYYERDDMSLADAQRAKFELVCTKLQLRPGMRMLDVGCGWGSLSIHAARHHGVHVTGITLSREQLDVARKRAADQGVSDLLDFRLLDYRDLQPGQGREGFDAAASLEMGEHVGDEHYPTFVATVFGALRPGASFLVQQMSRAAGDSPGGGPFIEAYIAPDMHMRPLGETIGLLEAGGFEVRDVEALREHYVRTGQVWLDHLEARWADVVALVGEEVARVWRLYLVGGGLAFEERRMGVDQILVRRPDDRAS